MNTNAIAKSMILIASITMHLSTIANNLGDDFVTVGNTAGCDFVVAEGSNALQNAIEFGAAEVRVQDITIANKIVIDDIDLSLIGGYGSCEQASNDIDPILSTQLSYEGTDLTGSLISVRGSSSANNVLIKNFKIIAARLTPGVSGAGINAFDANVNLTLENTELRNNESLNKGGGISIVGGNSDFILKNTRLMSNTANQGGGIYCQGTRNSILLVNGSTLFDNEAVGGDGGGALIENGCQMTVIGDTDELEEIDSNVAFGHGGGVFVDNAQLFLEGQGGCLDNDDECGGNFPVSVTNNVANSGNGGGIALVNNGLLGLDSFFLANNRAGFDGSINGHGGAVSISDNSRMVVSSHPILPCWSPGSCNQISGNIAHGDGGAFYVKDESFAQVSRTMIIENSSDTASIAYISGKSEMRLLSSVAAFNSLNANLDDNAQLAFLLHDELADPENSNLLINHSSLINNDATGSTIFNSRGHFNAVNSIITNGRTALPVYFSHETIVGDDELIFDCVIVNTLHSLPPEINNVVDMRSIDIGFVDMGGHDFHLLPGSPAIDFCPESSVNILNGDIDLEPRGVDRSEGDQFGVFDVGADEVQPELSDLIFKNGFSQLG